MVVWLVHLIIHVWIVVAPGSGANARQQAGRRERTTGSIRVKAKLMRRQTWSAVQTARSARVRVQPGCRKWVRAILTVPNSRDWQAEPGCAMGGSCRYAWLNRPLG
jgi:hypothetical protein